jgi:hypothetical protein
MNLTNDGQLFRSGTRKGLPTIRPEPAGPGLCAKPSFSTQVIRVNYRGYLWSPLLSNNETF